MTPEPQPAPPSGTGDAAARACDLLAERSLGEPKPVYGAGIMRSAYPVWQALNALRLEYPLGPRDKNGKLAASPWDEPLQSTPLADILEVARLAREHSTPFGEEPAV